MIKLLTLDKPMASFTPCHLELVVLAGNLVKSCSSVALFTDNTNG